MMRQKYHHTKNDGEKINLPVGKVVCVGRNYLEHITELGNSTPEEPLLFIKPETSVRDLSTGISWPQGYGECHYETEISVLILEEISNVSVEKVKSTKFYYGVGLDLTLRQLQQKLKDKGEPWEKAKAFDGACILTGFDSSFSLSDIQCATLGLSINGEMKQNDTAKKMMHPIDQLISYISKFFTLLPGDVVLTGTPKGVGALYQNDKLVMSLNHLQFSTHVK